MALIKYNSANLRGAKQGTPTMRVHRKSAFTISTDAAKMMGYKEKDYIQLYNDDESGDWYISKSNPTDGFRLRRDTAGANARLAFNNTYAANMILDGAGLDGDSYKFIVGSEPIEVTDEDTGTTELAYCIIIASAKP